MIKARQKKTNNIKRTGEQGQRNNRRGCTTGNSEVKQQRKKAKGVEESKRVDSQIEKRNNRGQSGSKR